MSNTFLVKSRIQAKLNLQCETTIFWTVLQIRTNTHSVGRVYGDRNFIHTLWISVVPKTENKEEKRREISAKLDGEEKKPNFLFQLLEKIWLG